MNRLIIMAAALLSLVSCSRPRTVNRPPELDRLWKGSPVEFRHTPGMKAEAFGIEREGHKFVISSADDAGALYGVYSLLRDSMQIPREEAPAFPCACSTTGTTLTAPWSAAMQATPSGLGRSARLRIAALPDYARENARIGINGTVLNNVNASPQILSHDYLVKVARLADVFRPYGIKVYLSVNFASPMVLDSLPTADPLAAEVTDWWKNKADEIYSLIPDFGGFLVKANSEGQPGPMDFGRSHADGANMLARALKPHGGIVMWRAFVYSPIDADRAKQAYMEFQPLDGKFDQNVIIQIKNGPIDFQPREPYSPLFGAMPQTDRMVEFSHSGISRPRQPSGLPGPDVDRIFRLRETLLAHSHRRSGQHRRLRQHDRQSPCRSQLACLRTSGMGPAAKPRPDSPRVDRRKSADTGQQYP